MKLFVYDDGKTESYVGEWDIPNGLGMYFFGVSEGYGKPRGYSMTASESIEFVDAEQFVTIRREFRAKEAAKSFAKIEDDRYRREWEEKMRPYREAEEKRLMDKMEEIRDIHNHIKRNAHSSCYGSYMAEHDVLGAFMVAISLGFFVMLGFALLVASF